MSDLLMKFAFERLTGVCLWSSCDYDVLLLLRPSQLLISFKLKAHQLMSS